MGEIIEFVGKPGCGKSTIVASCTPNPDYIIQTKDLRPSAQEREWIKSVVNYPLIHNFIKDYPGARELFIRKLIETHYKIKRKDGRLAILDEGLLERMVSIPFEREIIVNTAFLRLMDEVNKIESLVFNCQCPIDIDIERLQSRESIYGHKVGDIDEEELKKKLRIKQHNIDTVLSFYKGYIVTLDMLQPVSTNVEIVRDTIRKFVSGSNEELFLPCN